MTTQNISNLLGMARTALLAGNNDEALSYFNRVLEADPTISEAWLGKGKAAAWQSNLANIRLHEAMVAFGHAIANAPDQEKAAVTEQAVNEANGVVVALYGMARNHMDEFVALDGTWAKYLNQTAVLIDALEQAHAWAPRNAQILENIVHLCKDNIEGVSFRNFDNTPGSWHLAPDYETKLKAKLDAAIAELKALNPAYAPPSLDKKKSDACFVVTATMGDADDPTVKFMRHFRDEWLDRRQSGRWLIRSYYRHGPRLAAFVAGSQLRRRISLILLVRPAECIAKLLMGRIVK